jgi:two-component system response regulator PilR (NtrC family)
MLSEIEKDYLLKALELSNGSKKKAAELLGLTLDSIKYRLKKIEK